ncbi:MAG: response regulator [Clostridia bacterium]|nr:response regulator [Clostridia bacterium]
MAKIIVVDDEKSIRLTFTEFLSKEGYEVSTFGNVEDALSQFKKSDFDLIITDIIMPKISGMELLKEIYNLNPDIPVIIMTGEPTVDTAMVSVKNKAYDYLLKPVDKSTLLAAVNRAVQYKQTHDLKVKLENENREYQNNLEKLVDQRTSSLQKAMHATISTVASVTELRDPYTAGHERRVGNMAVAIGKKMNLDKQMIDSLYVAGYLHDIGKISIPAEILSKPGKLSSIEFEIIKTHVECGYKVLFDASLPWEVAEIVNQHHERLNGSGYPNGLKADQIRLESRILMVADVVEAMTSHRPYRTGLGLDAALKEISSNKGVLYDETVVEATIDLFLKDNYTLEDLPKDITFEI